MDASTSYGSVDAYLLIGLAVLFAGILYWAFRPKNRRRLKRDSQTSFHDPFGSGKNDDRP